MAVDESVAHMTALVGHDGSEILWPTQPEPFCRKGHHIEEIQYAVLNLGISLAPFVPQFEYNPGGTDDLPFQRYYFFDNLKRIQKVYNGIMVGEYTTGHPHAVAWSAKEGLIYDPDGGIYSDTTFRIECFYAAIRRA